MKVTAKYDIDEMLNKLSDKQIEDVKKYVEYLLYKKRKNKAFVKRVLEIRKNSDTVEFNSVEEAVEAIKSWGE